MSRRRLLVVAGLVLGAAVVAIVLMRPRASQVVEVPPEQPATPTSRPEATPLPSRPRTSYTPIPDTEVSPVVVERSPARGEALAPTQPIKLVFDRPMDRGAVAGALKVSPDKSGKLTWSDDRTVSFEPDTPWDRASVFDVVLGQEAKAQDGAVLNGAYQFRVTTAGYLEVGQVIPAQGTQGAPAASPITVIFNRPVVALRIAEEQGSLPQPLRVVPVGGGEPVAGQGEWLNTSIYVFRPSRALVGGTTYSATVDPGLQDVDGNPLEDAFTWQFSVAPPQVLMTQPEADAPLVGVEQPLRVEFNQPVPPAGAALTLRSGSTSVPGTVGTLGQTLLFTPTERLQFDTSYTAEIPAGTAGLAQLYRWTFRTVPLPRIESTKPADGEQQAPPFSPFEIKFNAPIDPTTVERNLEWTPALTDTEIYTSYNDFDRTFTINLAALPSTDYEVRIGPNIADPYGNTTGESRTVRFRTDRLPPSVNMVVPEQVGTYNAAEPSRLLLQSVNSSEATLSLYRITTMELMRANRLGAPPSAQNRLRQWTVALQSPLDERVITPVDLVEGGGTLEPGAYLVTLEDQPEPWLRHHMLVVSDLNLTLKSGEREALVWANRLSDGQPAAGVPLTFYTGEGVRLGTATTDDQGIARLSFEPPTTSSRYAFAEQPFAAIGDGWSRGIAPYEFGVSQAYGTPPRIVALYTDRPIYRPGQTVHFKGVVRNERDVAFSLPDGGTQIDVVVRNQNGEEISRQRLPLSPLGSFDGEIALPADAQLGQYSISDEQSYSSSFTVAAYRAPEFEVDVTTPSPEIVLGTPSRADVQVRYFFGGSVAGVPVEWNVLAEPYHFEPFGLERYTFTDEDDPWRCFDCWWQPPEPPAPIMSGRATTDAQGNVSIAIPAALQWSDGKPITTSVRLTIEATAFGRDNSVLSGRAELVAHQAQIYVGLAAQSYVSTAGQPAGVDIVTTDTEGTRLPNQEVDVEVERYEWTNRLVQTPGGGSRWESQERRTPIAQQTLRTNERAEATFRFTPTEGGTYRITTRAADGTRVAQSGIFVWVAGEDYVPWQRSNNDRLTLIGDRTQYAPGDTARILIPSPFTGPTWALITVERGGILKHEVLRLETNSTVYDLPITAEHAPNIFVGVVLFTGSEGEPRVADYKVGILPLRVDPIKQSLQVTLQPEAGTTLEPGSEARYSVEVTDGDGRPVAAELSLDLVDKAILSLLPRTPDVLRRAFYSERGLGIATASGLSVSADRLVEEILKRLEEAQRANAVAPQALAGRAGEGTAGFAESAAMPMAAAGGTAAAADSAAGADQSQQAAPDASMLRSNFADTAFWQADFTTDGQGRGSVTITLPDNLTTWVLRGVALTAATQVGESAVEVVATRPLMIRPVTPRFLVVDDQVELAANVSNNTDQPLEVEVALAATGIAVTTPLTQTINVPARGEAKATWNALALDAPAADVVFTAASGTLRDAAKPRLGTGPEGTLPIYRYSVPETVGTGGELRTGGSRTEVIALPSSLDDSRGEVSVRLDPSLAAGMRDGLRYLENYPEDGTEQIVSSFLPNVLTYRALQKLGLADPELEQRLPDLIRDAVGRLKARQHADGGWGWWDEAESNPYITAYTVLGLARTREAGFEVDDAMLQNGARYVQSHREPITVNSTSRDANLQAFFAYVLAESGQDAGELASLKEFSAKLSSYGQALLAMVAARQDAADPIIKSLLSDLQANAIMSATGAHWEEENSDRWLMNTDTRSTAIILQALTRLDPANQLNANVVRWLMVARRDGVWETTQESAWALMALTDWMEHTGELNGDYDYAAWFNGTEQRSGHVAAANVGDPVKFAVDITELARDAGNRLQIGRGEGPGILYYTAHLRAFLPVREVEALDRGLHLQRRYTLASCTDGPKCPEVTEVNVGDVVRVEITLVAPNDLYYLRVEDPLPAGMEAVDTGLATTSILAQGPQLARQTDGEQGPRPWEGWWHWYSHSEMRDEKVVLFAPSLAKGTYEYSYTMRATLPGTYNVIPTTANETYFPEVYGRGDGQVFVVR